MIASSVPCVHCDGLGHTGRHICESCAGSGLVPELRDSERRLRAAETRMRSLAYRIRSGL